MADPFSQNARRQFVIIGNPENRRVDFFQCALAHCGQQQATILSYFELLRRSRQLSEVLTPGTIVRIESPGENFEVEKLLLGLGAAEAESEGSPFLVQDKVLELAFDRGLILYPRQWFLGFRLLMQDIGRQLSAAGGVHCMNAPSDIIEFFDKMQCSSRCQSAGCPVPESLNPVHSFDELIARMDERKCRRVFLKLAHSSSASGVVAFHKSEKRMEAITSSELVRSTRRLQLYNSLKIRRYTNLVEIRDLIDVLCSERVHVEKWLPKASLKHGTTFDLRVVVINGHARHFVVRESRSPLTNLHLGNRRGDGTRLIAALGPERWQAMLETCEHAAGIYPNSLHVGVDALLTPGFHRRAILELNAFGDLLPGILHQGLDTYAFEVQSVLQK